LRLRAKGMQVILDCAQQNLKEHF
jgi:hypothetical protein